MSYPYEHMYQFTPCDGPCAGVLMFLPRRYDAFTAPGGCYVWSDLAEGYIWREGMKLKDVPPSAPADVTGGAE